MASPRNELPQALVGCIIDHRYKIEKFIAQGSFGYVYEATHEILGHPLRKVAFKLLKETSLNREKIADSLKDALSVTSLCSAYEHSQDTMHIIRVYDVGICEPWDNRGFVVMEYISNDLEKVLENRHKHRLPVNTARNYAIQICRGIALAHKQNPPVLHRDIKPGNILIEKTGKVTVSDFGLAQAAGIVSGKTTGAGDYYCQAPESLEGECSTRTDVYSIGLILFEMLTGEHPFRELQQGRFATLSNEDQIAEHLRARSHGLPNYKELNPLLRNEPELCEVLDRCCQFRPEDRFLDAAELLQALMDNKAAPAYQTDSLADKIPGLLKKAKASFRSGDFEFAEKFVAQVKQAAKPEQHQQILGEAMCLEGEIAMSNGNVKLAQQLLYEAGEKYGHQGAIILRNKLLKEYLRKDA